MKLDLQTVADRLRSASPDEVQRFYEARGLTAQHPVYGALPGPSKIAEILQRSSVDAFAEWLQQRESAIQQMAQDPYNYGWEGNEDGRPADAPEDWRPMWGDADKLLKTHSDILVVGGNRSGKSEWAAKTTVKALAGYRRGIGTKPPITWCLAYSQETSKRDQQPYVYRYFPTAWKEPNKGITYSPRQRFSGDFFIAPNGAEGWFKFYKQDPTSLEGGQVDLAWADELIPVDQLVTLRGRTVDRHGKIIVTFTPIYGWNATVGDYLVGAEVIEDCACESFPEERLYPGLPKGRIPYIMQCVDPKRAIIFFQAKWNPWINYQTLVQLWQHRGKTNILIRLHGLTTRTTGAKFPKFGTHNIIPRDKAPKDGVDYHFTDFAWNRPWAMIWIRVKRIKDRRFYYVMSDWPDQDSFGEWVLPSDMKKDGTQGPAQQPIGYGTVEYAELMVGSEKEQGYRVAERLGDPRSGRATALTEDHGGTDIISMMGDQEIYITPAKGAAINEGVNMINTWLDYDQDRPIDALNQPSLYICEAAKQVIDCVRIWTGGDGEKGASKDFIDLLRYAATADLDEISPEMVQPRGQAWGY